ncbi:MAG: tRNA dihydrouridine synthase DusB [ANME-2 cluster archaeon]|nr:tRNA dihydrouridine synthase DusB [ANME-2 cluster archaeon]
MHIGPLKLRGNLLLAPMADVTDLGFRLLCKKYGAALVYSEMVDAVGMIYRSKKTISRIVSCEDERPSAIQLSGASAESLEQAAWLVEEQYGPDLIDINFGCPVRHIVKKGCGAALMKSPQLMADIVGQVSGTVSVPVTAKIRVYDDLDRTLETVQMLEDAGASALTVHARTRHQNYAFRADWDVIRAVKEELSIPVIANGDIVDEKSARTVLEHTRCDGLMIGRAAMGNPYIFKRVGYFLETGKLLEPLGVSEQVEDFFEYVETSDKYGLLDYASVKLHAKWFTRGIEGGRLLRIKINAEKDINSILEVMLSICRE